MRPEPTPEVKAAHVLLGGCPVPQLHFDYMKPDQWRRAGLTLKGLGDALESLRVASKDAIGYFWDNSHFYIDDIYGRSALLFFVSQDGSTLHLWEARSGTSVGDFEAIPDDIRTMIDEAGEGKVRCAVGGEWTKEWKRFSFAGAVCPEHYDPKVHLPPDTRGD